MRAVNLSAIEKDQTLTDSSKELLFELHENPTRKVSCVFDGSPAVVFRQMVAGCVALPNTIEQTLCPQHDIGRTPLSDEPEGDVYLVDLSVLGQWARYCGEQPRFALDPRNGLVLWENT